MLQLEAGLIHAQMIIAQAIQPQIAAGILHLVAGLPPGVMEQQLNLTRQMAGNIIREIVTL